MKRIIICFALLVGAVGLSVYSHAKITRADDELCMRITAIEELIPGGDRQELSQRAAELYAFWNAQEDALVHLTRHGYLDLIATAAARLPSLAANGEFGELGAELSAMRRHMSRVRASEMLTLDNLM